ncbi:transposase [Desulfosporosinus sp. BICA1-9]|uniref:transposase n=1 Tax=Desulfosporosinus sp. BICA1-9 TaxID=1531958 RepID=UPI00054C10B7|nr:transposase [Desulfosporosinus sp. BICA1-9]
MIDLTNILTPLYAETPPRRGLHHENDSEERGGSKGLKAIRVISLKNLCKPSFEKKDYGQGAGIPVLKTIWDLFDLSLLFSQSGIRKHSGISAWPLAFAYLCGLINHSDSVSQNAKFSPKHPFYDRFFPERSSPKVPLVDFFPSLFSGSGFPWAGFDRLQENSDSRLTDGDIIALDDTKVEHPHGKKILFLCWLFDSSDKRHVWSINLVSTLAALKNGLEYPMLWRFWVKASQENEKQSKLDLSKQMLLEVRELNSARLWVVMDRWFLSKKFLRWLMDQKFDWVTKAKRNTVLFRKIYDPVLGKEHYVKLNPSKCFVKFIPGFGLLAKAPS